MPNISVQGGILPHGYLSIKVTGVDRTATLNPNYTFDPDIEAQYQYAKKMRCVPELRMVYSIPR